MSIKVHGWDVSLNHSAFVELTDGELTNFWYWTTTVGSANRSKEHGNRLKLLDSKKVGKQAMSVHRLAWIENFIDKVILQPNMPDYVGIEDYAIRAEQGAHYLGEVGGLARILCWFRGVHMRLHDPISVKMYTAHDGTCQKDSIERAVLDRWGADFSKYNSPPAKPTARNPAPRQNRTTSEDLADAMAIAQMVWAEVRLRSGHVLLSDMHKKEVQVFNRVTKTYPISLLDREWIRNVDGTPTPHGKPTCSNCGSTSCCGAKPAEAQVKRSKVKMIKE